MTSRKTIERWATEAGVSLEQVRLKNGVPVIYRACGRCSGKGYIRGFEFIENGRCFACGGGKGRWVKLQSVAASRRRSKRKAEHAKEQALLRIARVRHDARALLVSVPELAGWLRSDRRNSLLRSFAKQLVHKGRLSEKQIETARKIAERAAVALPLSSVPAGRRVVVGKVLTVKECENPFQYSYRGVATTYKMLVEVETSEGRYRVFGTVPSSICGEVERGHTVQFTAMLEPKEVGFGYFSRPTKAEVLREEENENE